MIEMNALEISEVVSGRMLVDGGVTVSAGVFTDSREVVPNSLFVAKPGLQTDGHQFIVKAVFAGASLVLAEKEIGVANLPLILVKDVVIAMGQLAKYVVAKLKKFGQLQVIGITGSVGKTTTKDILCNILSEVAVTTATKASYNGEVGLPLTVFEASYDTKFLILEMGATKIGHIAYLASIAKPDVALVLGVGNAHSGEFAGIENIAIAKNELPKSLSANGIAVLNMEDFRVAKMASGLVADVVFYGLGKGSQVVAQNVQLDAAGKVCFDIDFVNGSENKEEKYFIHSKLVGVHNMINLLAAATVAKIVGVSNDIIVNSLNSFERVSKWRMEIVEKTDGTTIINDSYNANPQSVRAALKTLAYISKNRRSWAVLGCMKELGKTSIKEHDEIGRFLVRLNINKLLVIGKEARPLYQGAILEGSWGEETFFVATVAEAKIFLEKNLQARDVILFKASNSVGLGDLGDYFSKDRCKI